MTAQAIFDPSKAEVVVITGKGKNQTEKRAGSKLVGLTKNGWDLKVQIENLQTKLKEVNEQIIDIAGVGVSVVIKGVSRASTSETARYNITDADSLKEALGERFDDLTSVDIKHKTTPKLKEICNTPEHELCDSVRACVSVDYSTSVRWTAEKPA
ncbi:hypothetical protein HG263_05335 [Pseudoalteromonas sp. JBTF-M23]|uniref:Uncharacterized protein n=1 Tax=Pseudoalteromonas caenipelagi TaxID=2726988 RepID=A0A849VAT0_9GAMM|nr:hypothetical protein [Pseudoalteromonas caenipelagi]NOU49958.1 hypothetical protein [Pseudoalteromonas caenipelagi]